MTILLSDEELDMGLYLPTLHCTCLVKKCLHYNVIVWWRRLPYLSGKELPKNLYLPTWQLFGKDVPTLNLSDEYRKCLYYTVPYLSGEEVTTLLFSGEQMPRGKCLSCTCLVKRCLGGSASYLVLVWWRSAEEEDMTVWIAGCHVQAVRTPLRIVDGTMSLTFDNRKIWGTAS